MRKTRKLGIQKQVRKKQKSKRRGRGKEDEVPFLLKSMLSNVHLNTYGQDFTDPALVKYILKDIPRASVTEAIIKKEVTDLISQRLNRSAMSAKSNNYVIASEIINTIPRTHWTIARQKAELIKKIKIAEEALETYINYAKPLHKKFEKLDIELSKIYKEKRKLEKTIKSSELGKKFYELETQHKELVSNKSMPNKSEADLVSQQANSIRYGSLSEEFNKLNTIEEEIEKLRGPSVAARAADIEAYREEHKLLKIIGDLESQLEDLRTQERMLK